MNVHVNGDDATENPRESVDDFINGHSVVNLTGILACHSSIIEIGDLLCNCVKLSADSWIIDPDPQSTYNIQ